MKTYPFIAAALLNALLIVSTHAQELDRIEPPFWWQGMKSSELQILAYGPDIADLKPVIEHPDVKLVRTQRVENNNYLFLDLELAATISNNQANIQFMREGEVAFDYDYRFHERRPGSAQRAGFNNADAIYLIAPDRFANGDPSNDSLPQLQEKADRSLPGGRHGGDIAGMIKHMDYISDMGFTAIWPMPMLENDQPEYSYHGYSTTNHYLVDPRFGSNEDYRKLSQKARAEGVGLIQDVILNHIGSHHWWMQDLPSSDWLNDPEDFEITSHFRTAIQDPYAARVDKEAFTDGWFVDSMPDLNQKNPLLARYLIQNSIWWVEYADLYGIRTDTYGYSDKEFLTDWTRRIMKEYPNFNIVGEEWSNNPNVVAYWQKGKDTFDNYQSYLPSLMDFPMYESLRTALSEPEAWGKGLIHIYEGLSNDRVYADASKLVTFAENHDTTRLFSVLSEDRRRFEIAMAWLATMRGTPQFFYQSEILATSPLERNDGKIRSDFPGGWPGDKVNGFTGKGLSREEKQTQNYLKKLLNWRKSASAVHAGDLLHFAPHEGVYVYFRSNSEQTVMVAINHTEEERIVDLERYQEGLAAHQIAVDVVTGKRHSLSKNLKLAPMRAEVYELRNR